jgi:hypothetical protein
MPWRSNDRSMGRPHIRLAFTNLGQRNRVSSRACEGGEGPLAGRLITLLAVCVIDSVWLGSLGALRQPRDDKLGTRWNRSTSRTRAIPISTASLATLNRPGAASSPNALWQRGVPAVNLLFGGCPPRCPKIHNEPFILALP